MCNGVIGVQTKLVHILFLLGVIVDSVLELMKFDQLIIISLIAFCMSAEWITKTNGVSLSYSTSTVNTMSYVAFC